MSEVSFLYITVANSEEARAIAHALLEEKLVACVNILPGVQSLYWWEGKIEENEEVILIGKTRIELVDAVIEKVNSLHSYDCPCIVALPVEAGNAAFLQWIGEETQ